MMVLHSLAHGAGVISSDVGGIGRCLSERTGRVLPLDASNAAYAEAALSWHRMLQTDPAIGASCVETVAGRFRKDRMTRELVEDFSSLAVEVNVNQRRKDYQRDLMKKPILW